MTSTSLSAVIFLFKDINGLDWRFSCIPTGSFSAGLVGCSFFCTSSFVDFSLFSDRSCFSVFFESAAFVLPYSEFEKFEDFVRQSKAAKAAA